jgi:ABC-type bacteriocin/lantibiotic exporter with double-glycine peptidase domain
VPVALQTGLADCGAACLTMILCHHGYVTRVRDVRRTVGSSRDGVTALALVRAAREYGLTGRAFSLALADVARLPPCVVHWRFNHFVVLQRWTRRGVEIVDPAVGRRRMTCEEFGAGFTGVAIVFEPGPRFRPGRQLPVRPHWAGALLRAAVARHRGLLVQVLLASVLLQVLGLALPAMTEIVVDHLLRVPNSALLVAVGAGLVLTALGQFVLSYQRNLVLASLRLRADAELTTGVVRHLLALPYQYFAERGAADLVMRTASVSVIREIVAGGMLPALIDAPLAIGYVLLVFVRDPGMGGFLVAVGAVQLAILLATRRRISALAQHQLVAQAAAQGFLIEAIRGIETLKACGLEARAGDRWRRRFVAQLNATTRSLETTGLADAVLTSLRILAPVGLVWVGAWRVLSGDLEVGAMLALTALGTAALAPLTALAANLQLLQTAAAHLDRLGDIMEAEPGAAPEAHAEPLTGALEVRDVGFRYDEHAPWILRRVSFSAAPGQKIAIVGRSGSGKSTLAQLLLGLRSPTEGEIRYDGIAAAASQRAQFGVVAQEPALFTGTIRDNIGIGDPLAPLSSIIEAATIACVHDDIMRLPMRYETPLSEGGGLSGGERQRIALARALLAKPAILVLDEATSHLDATTEAAIERNLATLSQTRIVIAHRLSTVRDADRIVVLDDGRVLEHDTHDRLLARRGAYARLVATQTPA